MTAAVVPAVLALALALTGCGLKGPLFLPEKAGPVTTHPPQATPAAGSAATPSEVPPPPPPAAGDKTGG